MMGNVNQVTPDGSLTYDQTDTYRWRDPYTGQTYDIPRFTATQTLSPEQQAIREQTNAAELNLGRLANSQSGRLNDVLGRPFDLNGMPQGGDAAGLTMPDYQDFGGGPGLQTEVGDAGDIQRSYGADYGSNVQEVQDALMSRLQPSLDKDRAALEQRLANQGIQIGSAAYNSAMDDLNRSSNDARTGAVLAAGQEQSRLAGLAQQQAMFGNSAQQQAYDQSMGRAGLANSANQQMFQNQNMVTGQNNQLQDQRLNAQLSQFNAANAQRNQALNERFAERNQPINEITALLSGSQVSNPNFVNANMPTIPTTDVAGLINTNHQQQMAQWQANQGVLGGIMGGIGSLISLSDDDAKKDKKRIGSVDGEMGLWEYRYKGEPKSQPKHIGLMASEVEKVKPSAVKRGKDGLRRVDYGRALGLMGAN